MVQAVEGVAAQLTKMELEEEVAVVLLTKKAQAEVVEEDHSILKNKKINFIILLLTLFAQLICIVWMFVLC